MFEHGVEYNQQFAHGRDQRHLFRLTSCQQPLVVKGVVGQGKCPGKCSAKMSLRYAAMVSDVDGLGTIRCFHPGGPPASR